MRRLISGARILLKTTLKTVLVVPGLIRGLGRPRPPGLRVLFYHRVNPYPSEALGPVSREITVRPDAFARQLDYLRREGFRTLSPEELLGVLDGTLPATDRTLAITFDDGYEDNLLWAAPLLQARGFQAIVFVISDFLGKESGDVWPEGDERGFGRFLSSGQVQSMASAGLFVASHTQSHRLLSQLTDRDIELEMVRSRRALEETVGRPIRLLAYPGGDFDDRAQAAAKSAGYVASFTTIPGTNDTTTPRQALRRTEVSASDTLFLFRMKMAGALDWLWFKEAPALRRAIGLSNRLLLRLLTR